MFHVYIIYSEKADRYYIGHTNDPERRLIEHNTTREIKFTTKFRPWKMVLSFEVSVIRGEALKMERFIKKQKNRQFLKRLIESKDDTAYFERLRERVLG